MGAIRMVHVIGIGAGDPQFLTMQAITALNEVDVFFFIDKPNATGDLATLRTEICATYVTDHPFRIVHADEVERDRTPSDYQQRDRRLARAARRPLRAADPRRARDLPDRCAARLGRARRSTTERCGSCEQVSARDNGPVRLRVIPGISSVQALAAAHRIPMNRTGEPVHITTGRRIADGEPVDNTFVMLDRRLRVPAVSTDPQLDIYWGAYLGTPDQALVSGRLRDVSEAIVATRTDLRTRKGWIMDTYLLRAACLTIGG